MKQSVCQMIILPGLALLFAGCAPTATLDPARHPTIFQPLMQSQELIGQARLAGKNQACAAAYQKAVQMRAEAEKTYWGCIGVCIEENREAAKKAREAVALAKALCPPVPVAKVEEKVEVKKEVVPTPAPTPVAAPPVVQRDTDGDGVFDKQDKCPGTPRGAKADERGCWTVPMAHFEFDKATIKPTAIPVLNDVAAVLKSNPGLRVEIQGHTDYVGPEEYNQGLSERRANAVKDFLVKQGIDPSRLEAIGFGMRKPIATNSTAEGRAKNRRVQFEALLVGSKPVS